MADFAPIALFVYNRPEHTRRTIDALAANPLAIDSDLVIYADGPKSARDVALVHEVRQIANTVTGFRRVQVKPRERNAGLANSIIAGVSEICDGSGRVIVLEDDLIVAPQFLDFMNAGLDR